MPAELSEQIERFEEKFAENPDSLVFARLADLYRRAGDADRGLSVLQEGLERHPDYLSAHIVRARCLRDLGRQGEAEDAFERVLKQDEQNLVALRGLAEIARERGDLDEAERRYEELLALDPRNEEARSALEDLVESRSGDPAGSGSEDADVGGEADADDDAEAEADDEGPWWRSDEPDAVAPEDEAEGEPDGAEEPEEPEEPARSAGPDASGEPARAGADQSDVFSLAGPDEAGPAEEAPPPDEAGPGEPDDPDEPGEEAWPAEEAAEEAVAEDEPPDEVDADVPPTPEPASREEAEFLGLEGGEEDEDTPGEDVGDAGLPAEEELTERIEEIADTAADEAPDGPEEDGDAEDLLTETLADLYETQGFYREAVEMYEELLEERPGDEELRARLEAARSAMGEGGAGDGPDVGEARPEGGAGDEAVSDAEETPPAEIDAGAAEDPDATAGDEAPSREDAGGEREPGSARSHLRALLRGRAGEEGSAAGGPEPGP